MRKIWLYSALMLLSLFSLKAVAQPCGPANPNPDDCISCVKVTLPPPVTICPGATYTFLPGLTIPAGFTVKSYSWSGSTVTPAGGPGIPPSTAITPTLPVVPPPCSVVPYPFTLVVKAIAPNVVMNWDFGLGNVDFCSQYTYNTPAALTSTFYTVCADANAIPGWFTWGGAPPNFYDHTFGTSAGSMLIGQGDANVNVIWEQTVPVCPGEAYEMSYWQATLHTSTGFATTYADLYVSIIDAMGTVSATYGPFSNTAFDNWESHSLNWFNPSGALYTTAKIVIHGGGPVPGPWSTMPWGTVFALDDISFNRHCNAIGTMTINVEYPEITGPNTVCIGSTVSMTGCPPGGTWSSTAGVTVDPSGNVTGVSAGPATITYTSPAGCVATKIVNVLALPGLTGPTTVCVGSTIVWNSVPLIPGMWSASGHFSYWAPTPASSASFYAASPGLATIYFTDPATGCTGSATVTVNPRPNAIPTTYICVGSSVTLPGIPVGGTWSIAPAWVASIGAGTGLLTGLAAGTATVTYTLPTGCSTTALVRVYNCANGSGVVGYNLCQGQTATFFTAIGIPAGGTWTSSNTGVATVNPVTGLVTAVGGGPVTITYTVGAMSWSITITVTPPTTASVSVSCCPYQFTLTSPCPGATIYYRVLDIAGTVLGPPYAATAPAGTVLTYAWLTSVWGHSVYTVCIYGVYCNGCWWPVDSCASVNTGHKPASVETTGAGASSLTVVPNPNKGTFTVSGTMVNTADAKDVKLELVDMVGKVLHTDIATVENGEINKNISLGDNVPNGVYFIRVQSNIEHLTLKFVLDR